MITLSAKHTGANVVLTIADDGAGLDVTRIRAKAVEKGLVSAQAELSERELFNLIFEPGFTTAEEDLQCEWSRCRYGCCAPGG